MNPTAIALLLFVTKTIWNKRFKKALHLKHWADLLSPLVLSCSNTSIITSVPKKQQASCWNHLRSVALSLLWKCLNDSFCFISKRVEKLFWILWGLTWRLIGLKMVQSGWLFNLFSITSIPPVQKTWEHLIKYTSTPNICLLFSLLYFLSTNDCTVYDLSTKLPNLFNLQYELVPFLSTDNIAGCQFRMPLCTH